MIDGLDSWDEREIRHRTIQFEDKLKAAMKRRGLETYPWRKQQKSSENGCEDYVMTMKTKWRVWFEVDGQVHSFQIEANTHNEALKFVKAIRKTAVLSTGK